MTLSEGRCLCFRDELLLRFKPVDPITAVRSAALLPETVGFGLNVVEKLVDQSAFPGVRLAVYGRFF